MAYSILTQWWFWVSLFALTVFFTIVVIVIVRKSRRSSHLPQMLSDNDAITKIGYAERSLKGGRADQTLTDLCSLRTDKPTLSSRVQTRIGQLQTKYLAQRFPGRKPKKGNDDAMEKLCRNKDAYIDTE